MTTNCIHCILIQCKFTVTLFVFLSFFHVLVTAKDTLTLGSSLSGNETLVSRNRTFAFGFFSPDSEKRYYAGIWYACITLRQYVWVANRESPVVGAPGSIRVTQAGTLAVVDGLGNVVWETGNAQFASKAVLLDSGNLVLISGLKKLSWESFDYPSDTWLPGMKIHYGKGLTSWRSSSDPSPGAYSLRLTPILSAQINGTPPNSGYIPIFPHGSNTSKNFTNNVTSIGNLNSSLHFSSRTVNLGRNVNSSLHLSRGIGNLASNDTGDFSGGINGSLENGEFELVWKNKKTYWRSGPWAKGYFKQVPMMTMKYIYNFTFVDPLSLGGYFTYSIVPPVNNTGPVISGFAVNSYGEIGQYTWSFQSSSWNKFWKMPPEVCGVYGLCGPNGFCGDSQSYRYCTCLEGFHPKNMSAWMEDDWSEGCVSASGLKCGGDEFYEVGDVEFELHKNVLIDGITKSECSRDCLSNCSCSGFVYRNGLKECRLIFGELWNLRNKSNDNRDGDYDSAINVDGNDLNSNGIPRSLFVRVAACDYHRPKLPSRKVKSGVLAGVLCGAAAFGTIVAVAFSRFLRRNLSKNSLDDLTSLALLTMFNYKELQVATKNFSEKLGSGGFGTVYKGVLAGTLPIAVKKLEKPEGGEKQFRMEVSTIGMIQHVNLVRLRGFCSEGERKLLVYDYMPNGSLNSYLFGEKQDILDWKTRYQIALGTAKAIAYLHEECRDCIVHCDIKPENILLDENFNAKVSDFGLAKLIGRDFSRVLTTMRGTRGYLAPEWISGLPITAKADVYSFGMTLLEIIGGRRNFEKSNVESEKCFFPPWAAKQVSFGHIAEIVDRRVAADDVDEEQLKRMAMVAIWCIQDDEESRPNMGYVVKILEGIVEIPVPPVPRTLQALVEGNADTHTSNVDSEISSGSTYPCSITIASVPIDESPVSSKGD